MNQCLTEENLNRYREGQNLTPEEIREWDSHLAGCDYCRTAVHRTVAQERSSLKHVLLHPTGEAHCLSDDEIDACVRQTLNSLDPDEREWVEHHLQHCPHCRQEVQAHEAFHHEMRHFDWSALSSAGLRDRYATWKLRWSKRAAAQFARWNRFSLSARILVALVLGVLSGSLAGPWLRPLAEVGPGILKLLSSVAVPLIFIGVIHALMSAKRVEGKARRLIALLLTNSFVAACIGLTAGSLLRLTPIALDMVPRPLEATRLNVPDSLFQPVLENNVLLAILFAVGFGMALRRARHEQIVEGRQAYQAVEDLIETAYRCLQMLLQWVINLMPLAVFALAASLVARRGLSAFSSLGSLVAATLGALCLQVLYYLIRLKLETGIALPAFFKATRSALLMAFSTASSAATLPITYARAREGLNISESSVSLGVLVGGSVNRDGTCLFEALGVVFISQQLGMHLTLIQQAVILLMSIVASLCAPGVPATGLVTMMLIFQSLGYPQASNLIVLLIPLDWFLDRVRTTVNVLGHLTTACLLDGKQALTPHISSINTE